MQWALTVVKWVRPLKKSQSSWMSKNHRHSVTWITYQPTVSTSWVLVWFTALSWGGPLQKHAQGTTVDGVLSAQMSNSINQLSALPRAQHWDFSGLAYLCLRKPRSCSLKNTVSLLSFLSQAWDERCSQIIEKKFDKYSNMCFNGNTVFELMAADVLL